MNPSRVLRSAAAATGVGAAGSATTAHGLEVVEHEPGILAVVGHEVDLHAFQILQRAAVHDELETFVLAHVVLVGELVREGHAEVDATTAARAGEDAHALDVLLHLTRQFLHLFLRGGSEAEILFAELIYACRHFEIYLSIT